jgi:hypothetical protein
MKWSERYIGEWRQSKGEVFDALSGMIGQFLFVAEPLTEAEWHALDSAIRTDWKVILQYVSAERIITSSRAWESDEVEAMLVSVHCLAIISWNKLYNKYQPEREEDVHHDFMSAGEKAVEELSRYGLLKHLRAGGKWTQAGIDMLNGKLR